MTVLNRVAMSICALLIAALVVIGAPAALSAHAADPGAGPSLAITSISPGVAGPDKPVILAGTITAGTAPLPDPVVTAALGTTDLDTTSSLQAWNSDASSPVTRTVDSTQPGELPAGASTPFLVTIPTSALALSYSNANLPLEIELAPRPGRSAVRTWRTTLSFVKTAPAVPLPVTWLVPLTLPADSALFGPTGTARINAWAAAIGPGSRVDSLLGALGSEPVTWVIDPALIKPPSGADSNVPAPISSTTPKPSISPGTSPTAPPATTTQQDTPSSATSSPSSSPSFSPRSDTGAPSQPSSTSTQSPSGSGSSETPSTPADGSSATQDAVQGLAATLRSRLRNLPANQSVLWTAYDDPDVSALAASGTGGQRILSEEVARTLPADMRALSSTEVAWPAAGVDTGLLRTITNTWSKVGRSAPAVILPRDSISGVGSITTKAERSGAGTSGLLLYDQALSAIAGAAEGDPGLRAQQFLARTLAIYEEQPATSRSMVIAVPRSGGASPAGLVHIMRAARSAPWLTDRTGAEAVQIAGSARRAALSTNRIATVFPAPEASAVTPSLLREVAAQRVQLSGVNSLLPGSLDVISDRLRLVTNVGSTRWRGHALAASRASQYSAQALGDLLAQVYVLPSSFNFFTDRSDIQITVVNKLNRSVRGVQVVLQPRAIMLKVRRQPTPLNITATGRGIIRPQVVAAGSGNVPVDTDVRTSNGVALGVPRGTKAIIQVNVRPTATWIYKVLGGVAGIILIGGVVRSIRRGPRTDDPLLADPTAETSTPSNEIIADE